MAAYSKICVLGLVGQAVVARPVAQQSSGIIARADDEIKWHSDVKLEKVEWGLEKTADEEKEPFEDQWFSDLAANQYLEEHGVNPEHVDFGVFKSMFEKLNPDTKGIIADTREMIGEQVASAVTGEPIDGQPTFPKIILMDDSDVDFDVNFDTRPGLVTNVIQPGLIKASDSTAHSRRDFDEALRFPADAGQEVSAFTVGYTSTQSTSYNVEPTAAVVEEAAKIEEAVIEPSAAVIKEAAKVEEAIVVPTATALNGTLPTETPAVDEQAKFGAASVKNEEQKKKKGKAADSSTEEEEQNPKDKKWKYGAFKRDNSTKEVTQEPKDKKWKYGAFKRDNSTDEVAQDLAQDLQDGDEKDKKWKYGAFKRDNATDEAQQEPKDKKWKYGAFKKRGEYDQQWADYYNKAGPYAGLDYDVYEYLEQHEASQRPQPEPQPEPVVEETPIIIPAPQQPAPQPEPVPQPQQDAPIIPAPQPHEDEPKEELPAPVQAGQPGEEQLQDFVMFVPKDQSGGAKPYMVPANEYNPDTPPERLPPGVKPPPINLGGQPAQQGDGQEAIDVPLPDAPEGVEYEYVPVGPPGSPLSDGSHPLPGWFPTRPGPANVQKRGEIEERSCGGHPYGREWECNPERGCSGCYKDRVQDVDSSLSAVAKRGLKSKLTKPFKPKAPKISGPSFDYDNEANVFNPHVPPPPPYQAAPPPPPPAPKAPVLPKPKPVKFDIDLDGDDDDFDDDDYQSPQVPAGQGPIQPHPQADFADFSGNGNLADFISCELFRNRCLDTDLPEEEYPKCHQPSNPCQNFPFFAPFSESRVDAEHRPWNPIVSAYDENDSQPRQDFVKPYGGYPQVELQPEYPEFLRDDVGYYVPDCHTCGPCGGSYSESPEESPEEPSDTCPENTCPSPCVAYKSRPPPPHPFQRRPQPEQPEQPEQFGQFDPEHLDPEQFEYQQPSYDRERPEPVGHFPQREQDCYACEQPAYPSPHREPVPEPCYNCQYQPETYERAPEPQNTEQPCHACSKDFEPARPPSYACHEGEQPEHHVPSYEEPAPAPEPVYAPQPQSSEQPCYAREQVPEPQPEQYEPQPEPQPRKPCHDCAQPEVHEQPAPQPSEPAPEPQYQEPCYDCAQQPAQPQPEEPCHTREEDPESCPPESPCSGPNFERPTPDQYPHDGSYPIEEGAGLEPAQGPETQPTEDSYVHPDGSYSEHAVDHPEYSPECEPREEAPETSYPWHFPDGSFEEKQHEDPSPENHPAPECHNCQQGPAAEYQAAPEPECHECQQTPVPANQPAPEPQDHERQQGPEQYVADPEQAAQFPAQYMEEKSKPAPQPERFTSQPSPEHY